MPGWKRHSGKWAVLAAVLVSVGLLFGYAAFHPGTPIKLEHLWIFTAFTLLTALFTAAALRLTWRRRLHDLTRRIRQLPEDAMALHADAAPGELRPLVKQIDELREALERQTRTVEILQKEQQMAEITLQSLLGRADSEEGQSHSLVHRPKTGESTAGATREMVARLTPNLTWLAATLPMQKFIGWTIVELNARSILDYVNRDDSALVKEAFEKAIRHGEGHGIEFRLLLRGGSERHVQVDILTRYTPEGKPLHLRCHFIDISERIHSDRELRLRTQQLQLANERLQQTNRDLERLKESYRDLYHNAPVLYFSVDSTGRIVSSNETMLRTLGYSRDDLNDQPYTTLLTSAARSQHDSTPDIFQRAGEIETQWLKRDGSVIAVWIKTAPVLDSEGRFIRSRSAAQDVTERNRMANALRLQAEELQRANDQLRRINRELDDFTYVVSHDLKEPLRTLQAFSNFLAEDYGNLLGQEGKEYIGHLIAASKRLGALIDDLLTLSRAGRVINTPQVFDLEETLRTVTGDLAGLIQRKGAIVASEGPLPSVVGDPQRIAQLLANLIGNGLKYNNSSPPRVVIGVHRPADANPNGMSVKLQPGDDSRIVVYVRDNGIGIDPQYHEQIFGIFKRLHLPEEYEGTGAGLAISKKIVEAHRGRIWVDSQPGAGTTFYFTLPSPSVPPGPRGPAGRATMVLADSKS